LSWRSKGRCESLEADTVDTVLAGFGKDCKVSAEARGYRITMLAHCVNPNCGVPLHSFAEGRLFQFEVVSISISASDESSEPFDERPSTQTAQFWLCQRCATNFRLVLDPASGLKIQPIEIDSAELNNLPLPGMNLGEANNC